MTLSPTMIRRMVTLTVIVGPCLGMVWGPERGGDQCKAAIGETIREDRAIAVDDTPSRLQSTWLSQGCETRAGPEYVIRKYTFFENGTFLLLRHHYAEESCSIATHTVTARGIIRLLSASLLTPGATEARFQLDTVHVIPLNRQVAHKLGHRLNASCSPQPRWRPYVPQLVYEQPPHRFVNPLWEGPRYNSLQGHPPSRSHRRSDCLEHLGIEFGELRLLRVQRKPSRSKGLRAGTNGRPKVELLLGSLPPTVQTRWTHRPTGLQPTALLRIDTTAGCPMCSTISRGTETSPPVLHEVAALPALLGGSWLSGGCESIEGGIWMKRQLQVWPGDKLWAGRWDHYAGPKCITFLYAVTAAGSYVQRAGRQRRHQKGQQADLVDDVGSLGADNLPESSVENHEEKHDPGKDPGQMKILFRRKRDVEPWMTPELAQEIFEMYGPNKDKQGGMLPTSEEIREAIGKSVADDPFESTEETKSDEGSVSSGLLTSETIREERVQEERETDSGKTKRSLDDDDDSYRHLLQNAQPSLAESFAAMLRGNQRYEETTKKPVSPPTPTGTTELDLHVAESLLIPGDATVAARCGGQGGPMSVWPRNCIPHAVDAPSTLGLRARVGVNWSGQYTLLLGPRDDSLWQAPLHQCGPTSSHNPELRAHLRRSVGLRYGLLSSSASLQRYGSSCLIAQLIFLPLFYLL